MQKFLNSENLKNVIEFENYKEDWKLNKEREKNLNSENLKNVIEFENYIKIENWIKKGIKKKH